MKKTTAILSAIVAGTSLASAEELSVSTSFAWESEYVFRGVTFAEEYFAPSVDISYGGAYAGIWAAMPVDDIANEVDYYAGYGFGLNETTSADVGFTYYTFPDSGAGLFESGATFEVYGGLSFETTLAPSLYVYYDFDWKQLTIEGSIGHSFEVSDSAAIDVSAYLGYADADDSSLGAAADWTYYGIGVSYGYAINDAVSTSLFVNWAGCSEDTLTHDMNDDNTVWFGFSVSAGM